MTTRREFVTLLPLSTADVWASGLGLAGLLTARSPGAEATAQGGGTRNRPFIMVTLGDSIMWGQGMPEALGYLDYGDGRHLKKSFVLTTPSRTPEGLWIGGARFSPAPGTITDPSPANPANPSTGLPRATGPGGSSQVLAAGWGNSPAEEIQTKLEMAELFARISVATADQQTQARQRLQPLMLQALRRQQNDPICKMLLDAYESQHRGATAKP